MKQLIALLIVVLFLMGAAPAIAQGPVPIPPPPPGQPLPPAPVPFGVPIPKAPEQYLPTWQAPLPPISAATPTPVNFDWYDVITLQSVPVHMAPNLTSYVITRLPADTIVTVRWAGPGWLQLESGFAAGSYIQDNDLIRRL